MLTTFEYFGLG